MEKRPLTILKEYCKTHQLRYTPEREMIVSEVYNKEGHFDVDAIFFQIRKKHPTLKLAKTSIYRNIPHLLEAGLIRESFYREGHAYYEHTVGHSHHDHIRCLGCEKIMEFSNSDIDALQQKICKEARFEIVDHIHILLGYCETCQRQRSAHAAK